MHYAARTVFAVFSKRIYKTYLGTYASDLNDFGGKMIMRAQQKMYAEWTSLDPVIPAEQRNWSVLNKFPSSAGRDVSIAVVKHLAANLGINSVSTEQPSNLENDREVQWCLEVLCFGLSLPLSETEAVKDCVNVYCEWLTALTKPNICVPKPIVEDPNNYGKRMIRHLYNLFVPREDSTPDQVQRQILYCHRVLRCLQKIAHESSVIAHNTWEQILLLLLSINDTLLAPPPFKEDDLGDQLCERILGVLFEIWLISCGRCFPSPPLWKTFREMSCKWRHRVVLIDQWNRVNIVLTSRILSFMFGQNFPELKCGEEDFTLVPADMSNDCVSQTWFRFLHLIGNPIDLCKPGIISQTPRFFHYALSSETVIDPWQHQCLMALPLIFLKAMKGVSTLVNAFLGIQTSAAHIEELIRGEKVNISAMTAASSTPPDQRKIFKSSSSADLPKTIMYVSSGKGGSSQVAPASSSQPSSTASTPNSNVMTFPHNALFFSQEGILSDSCQPSVPGRPRCNSVLHLFGSWLFEASLLGCTVPSATSGKVFKKPDYVDVKRKSSSVFFDQKTSSVGMSSLPDSKSMPEGLSIDKFEAGQAEAIGALCRIICSKKTAEDILPVYLARFYLSIKLILCDAVHARGQVISSILLNSHTIFRQDLDGVHVLYPAYVHALEMVLLDAVPKFKLHHMIQPTDLRRAAIHILLSLLCLPLHYNNLPIKADIVCDGTQHKSVTFQSLKHKLVNLVIGAVKVETDAVNTQMLLGGLLLFVQDCSAVEEVEQTMEQNPSNTSDSIANLLDTEQSSFSSSESSTDHRDRSQSMPSQPPSPRLHLDPENLEYPDFETLSSSDSAYAMFLRATYLVCHKLISSWKTDLNVSLAAIELLAGLAKIKFPNQESLECKRAVKWISDFIVYQCSRPPPAHSKDLHSTIVAAYHCLTIWFIEHPYLLDDKECLTITFEVVELGISGSKSQPKLKDVPKMKAEKENKPVSMRVRDAAESVLMSIMTQVGYFPSKCGPESLSSLLNEESLFRHCNDCTSENITCQQLAKSFRYFVLDNSVIIAVMERSIGVDQGIVPPSKRRKKNINTLEAMKKCLSELYRKIGDEDIYYSHPTVTVLIRGPFGRKAWTIHQRHLPHQKRGKKYLPVNPGRPMPINDIGIKNTIIPQYFPDSIDRIPSCQIDKSIPTLDSVITEKKCSEHNKLAKLIHDQISFESSISEKHDVSNHEYPNSETECKAPPLRQEFHAAHLFLSQFGFLSFDALKESLTQPIPSLITLDQMNSNFYESLASLDKMSDRTSDTVFIFYVKSNQKKASDILQNVTNESNVNPHFLEFLLSLGWPVDVSQHAGWTGHVSTSWKIINNSQSDEQPHDDKNIDPNHGGSLFDGKKQVKFKAFFILYFRLFDG
ncbi:Ral GTPase-activating protein subunit beta [Nymphon striatum]|nr:Ral GTPase-activating protein subunit beta [Nymphon striatum]